MVNLDALKEIRQIAANNPVVFMPTHRTYVDFLLMSLLCYDQDLKLPAICAGADFLSSRFVGEALRRCGAFFIRRSFGSVSLHITFITQYHYINVWSLGQTLLDIVYGIRTNTFNSKRMSN